MVTELSNFGIKRTRKIFAIINTAEYCGDMGVIVVQITHPLDLQEYGFTEEECKECDLIGIGDKFDSHDYGVGCVVVRME